MAFLSPFLFLSPSNLVVVGVVSNTELECPSEFRASQAVARICVPVSTTPTTYPGPFEPSEA
jgi:hypothetical protein